MQEVDGSSPLRSMGDFLLAISFTEHQTCAHNLKGIVNISCWAGSVDFEKRQRQLDNFVYYRWHFLLLAFAKIIIIFSLKQKNAHPLFRWTFSLIMQKWF